MGREMSSTVMRSPVLDRGTAAEKRREIKAYFTSTWELYERLFEVMATDEAYYLRADPLRHPLIFYLGHTDTFFGNKLVGKNYGWVFTAYGVAGIAGPILAGWFKDAAENSSDPKVWMAPFIVAGVACLIGSVIMLLTHPPKPEPLQKEARKPSLTAEKVKQGFAA